VRRRFHWGAGVALFYAAFALATVAFVIFAIANPAALVTDEYYLEAMRHDRRIEAAANARAAGVVVTLAREGGRRVALLQLAPQSLVTGAGTVTWYRPSDAALDRAVPLALDDAGMQRIDITDLASGLWRMKVEWLVGGRPFYFEEAIMVTP
jgi:nitrogen fixation protein FixH